MTADIVVEREPEDSAPVGTVVDIDGAFITVDWDGDWKFVRPWTVQDLTLMGAIDRLGEIV
jgi:hypothetical protein